MFPLALCSMHFLGTFKRKPPFPLFPELLPSPRHILQFAGCSREPYLVCPLTGLCPCFMQRCEHLATKPLRVWGFCVPKPLLCLLFPPQLASRPCDLLFTTPLCRHLLDVPCTFYTPDTHAKDAELSSKVVEENREHCQRMVGA